MARSWWSMAWTEALDGIAGGARNRVGRGRRLAREQPNAELRIEPGGVEASIVDDNGESYEAFVGLRQFRDDEWEAVFDAVAAKASHAAALLDGELDPGVVEDAAAIEVDILPRPRDLHTVCTCPDEIEPCTHAAAVCALVAEALADDPFVLLLLRGRRRDEVLDGVRAARAGRQALAGGSVDDAAAVPGTDASAAWHRELAPLPGPLPIRPGPGRPAVWPSEPPAHAPFDGAGLRRLVTDAAHRAWDLLAGGNETGLTLDARTDVARRSVGTPRAVLETLAVNAEIATPELEQLSTAWQFAGPDGVRAAEEPRWSPPPLEMAWARDQIIDAGLDARRVHVSGNRVTAEGRLQFRRSRDGHWYAFTKETGRWTMAAPPERIIDSLLEVVFD